MPTLEERVAYLEGRVEAQAHGTGELRELVGHLDHKVDRFREELLAANVATNARIEALDQRLSGRIEAVDQKVDRVREELLAANVATNARIEAVDQRLGERIAAVDQKVDRFRKELAGRIEAVDHKVDRVREELAGRIETLDQKVSKHFMWLVGIQVAVLLAVIGAVLGR